ncbi:MAG: DMT family transporter [Acidimicrobiia bacterium]|nr:DMT family transporter [Acidimicrobiia bacterium]
MRTSTATTLVVAASIAMGLVSFFARSLTDGGMAPAAVAASRFVLAAVVLLPFVRPRRNQVGAIAWAVGSGAGLAFGWIAYVEALRHIPVSTVGVVYMTYPLFAIVAAWLLFDQRPGGRALAGGSLVVVAALVALAPGAAGGSDVPAMLVAFVAPIGFGATIAVLTERLTVLRAPERLAWVSTGAVATLLPIVLRLPADQVLPASASGWWLLVGIALLTSLVPQLVYAVAAPAVGAAKAATAGSVELPTILVAAWVLLGETPGWHHLAAILLVAAATAVTPSRRPSSYA